MAVDREGKAVGPQISEELAAEMAKLDQKITVIDEEGKVRPCNICHNPNPGMAHECTNYLWILIEKYGGHTAECITQRPLLAKYRGDDNPKCDCGWAEVNRP